MKWTGDTYLADACGPTIPTTLVPLAYNCHMRRRSKAVEWSLVAGVALLLGFVSIGIVQVVARLGGSEVQQGLAHLAFFGLVASVITWREWRNRNSAKRDGEA